MITKEKEFQVCVNCLMQKIDCYCDWNDYAKEDWIVI
jgi:transcription elongation factor Elf1